MDIRKPGPLLLEREREVASLEGLIERVAADGAAVGLIEGSAGIGKSRLLAELQARAAAEGFRVLAARGSALEREFTFGAVRQLFEPLLADPAGRDRLLDGAAAAAEPVFAVLDDAGEERVADVSFAALHGLYWLTANVAAESTLVAIDDLHWCDPPSLRFFAYLASRLEGLPILLAGALRPSELGGSEALIDEIARAPSAVFVRPDPLSQAAVRELVEGRLGSAPDEAFVAACHVATGGNPLLLDQLLASLLADGVQPDADHVPLVRDIGPRAVSRTVLSRLGRLPGEAVEVARAVAVLGDRADLPAIAALAGLDEPEVGEAADGLVGADILRPQVPLTFVHPLVRDAVYEDLPPARRELQHAQAAEVLREVGASDEQVAAHALLTAGRGQSWIVDCLLEAARTATRRGAADSAVAYLRRALEEPPPPERWTEVVLELGVAEALVQGDAAVEHLREAYAQIDDPVRKAKVALLLGGQLAWISTEESVAVFERAIEDLAGADLELERLLEAGLIENALTDPGQHGDISRRFEEIRRHATGDATVGERMLLALLAFHDARACRPAADAVPLARRALAGGTLLGPEVAAGPLLLACTVLTMADQEDALAFYDDALSEAHRRGSMFGFAVVKLHRAQTHAVRGELEEAETEGGEALRAFETWSLGTSTPYAILLAAFLSDALMEQGKLEEAGAALARAEVDETMPESTLARAFFASRGRLRMLRGDHASALEDLLEAGRRFEAIGGRNPALIPWRSQAALALLQLGDPDRARRLAAEELGLARTWGAPRALGAALRAMGELEHLREAVEVLSGSPARLEHAKALAALGAALRRAGSRSEAREPLREALDLAERCGALTLVERTREELVATGARPRHTARHGVDALTPSELRVARLAADGHSNREIAQTLFVTIRTVEMHLTHAYQKLEIGSRRQLAQALGVAPPDVSS
jgi:DNA-binding CsgD family transcriptional regulator